MAARTLLIVASAAILFAAVVARCPNDCSKHGTCGENNACMCHRNFMGADCSERICAFDYAFIDTPLGDMNSDGKVDMQLVRDPRHGLVTEGYPINYGYARPVKINPKSTDVNRQDKRWDEGHFYRECSNKGICNRKSGQCECFPGYEGEGCARTTCPGGITCNGHGVCQDAYLGKQYNLWDSGKTQKCVCDAGYSGPDCSLRNCPKGTDPVYHRDKVTSSIQRISFNSFTKSTALDFLPENPIQGDVVFTITVIDAYGDQWTTQSNTVEYEYSCGATDDLWKKTKAVCKNSPKKTSSFTLGSISDYVNVSLQALPNNAVPNPYVWEEWRSSDGKSITRYPSASTSGFTQYWRSAKTRWPNFKSTSSIGPCGASVTTSDGKTFSQNGWNGAYEGLCLFISTDAILEGDGSQNYEISYYYDNKRSNAKTSVYTEKRIMGRSYNRDVKRWESGTSHLNKGSQTVALIEVQNVGGEREWDPTIDGQAIMTYGDAKTTVCSSRGLCDYATGMCQCVTGYNGHDCSIVNGILFEG